MRTTTFVATIVNPVRSTVRCAGAMPAACDGLAGTADSGPSPQSHITRATPVKRTLRSTNRLASAAPPQCRSSSFLPMRRFSGVEPRLRCPQLDRDHALVGRIGPAWPADAPNGDIRRRSCAPRASRAGRRRRPDHGGRVSRTGPCAILVRSSAAVRPEQAHALLASTWKFRDAPAERSRSPGHDPAGKVLAGRGARSTGRKPARKRSSLGRRDRAAPRRRL